jgi:hypothetical protein
MAYSSNPLRNEAEEFIRAEIARLGPDALDKGAIVRRYVERGASKTRVHEWIKALVHDAKNPAPDTLPADLAVAEAAMQAAGHAKVLDSLPGPEDLAQVEMAARVAVDAAAPAHDAPLTLVSGGTAIALERVQKIIGTIERVMTYSHHADGRIRNPRVALASAEALRKTLETALKLYETISDIQTVQRFIDAVMAELRAADRDLARCVVERLQGIQGRW